MINQNQKWLFNHANDDAKWERAGSLWKVTIKRTSPDVMIGAHTYRYVQEGETFFCETSPMSRPLVAFPKGV